MKKNLLLILICMFAIAFTSCKKETRVSKATERLEEISSDLDDLTDEVPSKIEDESDMKKLMKLQEKGEELESKYKNIENEFSSLDDVNDVSDLTPEEKEDLPKFMVAYKKAAESYMRLIQKLESLGSSVDLGSMMGDDSGSDETYDDEY